MMPFVPDLDFAGNRGRVRNLAAGPVDDLTVHVSCGSGGSGLRIDFDANLAVYDSGELSLSGAASCMRWTRSLHPSAEQALGRLELLLPEERLQVLEAWNNTDRALAQWNVPELFEQQAASTPMPWPRFSKIRRFVMRI